MEGQEPTSEIKEKQPRSEREENCEKVAAWEPEERRVSRVSRWSMARGTDKSDTSA